VVTDKGTIHAEHVVNAGGLWAREVGAMAGVYLPLHPMEHQYIVTDEVPEVAAMIDAGGEHPHVMDPAGESYLRQEGRGLCIGFYEQPCRPWAVDGTPWEFGHELLPDDFDKIEDSIEFAYRRFPALGRAGVKSVIHGPFTFAPDGNPLVGPVPGLRNYWSACGVMAGFSQGGGVGLMLAQWMTEGECERDVTAMDVARFGDWISPGYTRPKVVENYQKRFSVSYPNEELPAARPLRQTPMYDIFDRMGAVWGAQFGLEVVNYFAEGYGASSSEAVGQENGASSSEAVGQEKEPRYETPSFRRSNAWEATAREVRAVRAGVGINEVHNFGKYLVTGPNARDWLDRIMAGRIPAPGRLSLTPMLSPKGRLWGDFTVSCLKDETFQLTASYGAQAIHMRWFAQNEAEGVRVENISDRLNGFQIAGPKARDVLVACTRDRVADMRFMDIRRATIGMVDCLVQRVSYTGDLGFEIYCDPMAQRALWQVLWDEGQKHGMRPFGMRAMMSLRLDRFFGAWLREFSPDYTPGETGMDRFIAWKKNVDFIGRAAAEAERATGAARRLVAFEVAAKDADVNGYEPVWIGGEVRGFCTSGGYSHHAGKSIALALIPTEAVREGLQAEIEILGEKCPATLITTPLVDPEGTRMRG
jgi:dimethylglycine dehydrogenase